MYVGDVVVEGDGDVGGIVEVEVLFECCGYGGFEVFVGECVGEVGDLDFLDVVGYYVDYLFGV